MLDMTDKCYLLDMEATGLKFTWYKKQVGKMMAKRHGRVLANQAWCIAFPEAFVENLHEVYFDHCPMLL